MRIFAQPRTLRVALQICALASLLPVSAAALAAPPLSDVAVLPGDAALAPAAGEQSQPVIAAGADGTALVVWTDARSALTPLAAFGSGPYFEPGIGTMRDIYAARLDAAGNVVDTTPIVVTRAVLEQGFPAVAWNGQNWLVVWEHETGIACCRSTQIYAARVSPAGVVLDDPPIVVETTDTMDGLLWPTVASDGSNWAVAWRDLDQATGVYTVAGARISPDGVVLDPSGKLLREDTWNSYPTSPSIAFAGDEYLLVWSENSAWVQGQRLTPTLDPIGSVFKINLYSPSVGLSPSVESNGTDFFVAWFENRYYGWAQARGSRVSHAGSVLDPNGVPLTAAYGYTQFTPCVAWDGTNWIVAYNYQSASFAEDVFVTRVQSNGQPLDQIPVVTLAGSQSEPCIATLPTSGSRIVWTEMGASSTTAFDIYVASLTTTGTVGTPACAALGAPRQTDPRFVAGGSGFLAVYHSETSTTSRILAQRLDPLGTPLDAEPIEIAASGPGLVLPSAAWNGSLFYVVWSDATSSTVYGRRLGANGVPLDAPVALMPGDNPDVAALGDTFLVAGTYQVEHVRNPYAVRVRGADGVPLDTTPRLVGYSFATEMSVAALGQRWLVAWQWNPSHDDPASSVLAAFVTRDGTPGSVISVATLADAEDPYVAIGRDTALVFWSDDRVDYNNRNIFARRILPDGTMLDGTSIVVSNAPNHQSRAAAAWNGSEYLAAYLDFRNDNPNGPYVGDVYGAEVAGGAVFDPLGFAVTNVLPVMETEPTVAAAGGHTLLGFVQMRNEAPYGNYRIAFRRSEGVTAVSNRDPLSVPTVTASALTPSASAMFRYTLGEASHVELRIYDTAGALVRTLVNADQPAGSYRVAWDGSAGAGPSRGTGLYVYQFASAAHRASGKVLVLR